MQTTIFTYPPKAKKERKINMKKISYYIGYGIAWALSLSVAAALVAIILKFIIWLF